MRKEAERVAFSHQIEGHFLRHIRHKLGVCRQSCHLGMGDLPPAQEQKLGVTLNDISLGNGRALGKRVAARDSKEHRLVKLEALVA